MNFSLGKNWRGLSGLFIFFDFFLQLACVPLVVHFLFLLSPVDKRQ